MSTRLRSAIVTAVATSAGPSFAQPSAPPPSQPSQLALTPHLGVIADSAFVDGPIVFSNGDVDYILVDPSSALLLGLELSYAFKPTLAGVLGLSYATADARYIENNDLRPDVGFDTLRIQPGVMANVVANDRMALDLGGGLTIYHTSIDGLVWNGRRVDASDLGLGLFGAAAIDVPLTPRLAFHSHLLLELSRSGYGGLERAIALADRELGSDVSGDVRTALVLAIGLRIAL